MPVERLVTLLEAAPAGQIRDEKRDAVLKELSDSWEEFSGSTATKMEYWKVVRDGGPEELTWEPPILLLTTIRHGGTVLGSTRGEKQRWKLNVESKSADHEIVGHRQLKRRAPGLDVKPRATEVCEIIQQGPKSASHLITQKIIRWERDDLVAIYHGKIIPDDGAQQTKAGRRRRFREELKRQMAAIGWEQLEESPSLHALHFKRTPPKG